MEQISMNASCLMWMLAAITPTVKTSTGERILALVKRDTSPAVKNVSFKIRRRLVDESYFLSLFQAEYVG